MKRSRTLGELAAVPLLAVAVILSSGVQAAAEGHEYRLGQDSLVNTGKDNGFSEAGAITRNDPHWGWQLGGFYVTGFTRVIADGDTPIFLKNVGDEVMLWFDLEQDIDRLNENHELSISEDANGWDQRFQVTQQNFGRGALIVRHTDYTNETQTTLYTDFLAAEASASAETEVEVFEEGDYEVALNYEVQKPWADILGWNPGRNYYNYQVSFEFAVRNGNSMVFPFDVKTGAEMTNAAATEDGFRLDLAQSRYLDVDIRREVLNESRDGLTEDTRFNRPARDGSEYTEEGTYTITVRNRYTGQETLKTIYVGTDDLLKAHAATGQSIPDISAMLAEGATVAADGSIIPVAGPAIEAELAVASEPEGAEAGADEAAAQTSASADRGAANGGGFGLGADRVGAMVAGAGVLIVLVGLATLVARRRRGRPAVAPPGDGEAQ